MGIISNLFGAAPTAPVPTSNLPGTPIVPVPAAAIPVAVPNPAPPGNIPEGVNPSSPVATPETAPNGVIPEVAPVVPKTPDSPLDQFSKLWDTAPDANGKPAAPEKLDAAKLQALISKADFTKQISAENLEKINAGGEGAQVAFTESLNSVAQQVLMQATLAANKMQEQAIKTAIDSHLASIPEMIRTQNASNSLTEANPVFANPAVKPIIEAVQSQLAATNPNATPAELTKMAQDFVVVLGETFSPTPTPDANSQEANSLNWDRFLDGQ